ncbi:MAG TPA: Rne/Rng family ribonuclease [Gaiella sp.]|nr:Rne/Rng family ribonuclease [Gaiella sp.]
MEVPPAPTEAQVARPEDEASTADGDAPKRRRRRGSRGGRGRRKPTAAEGQPSPAPTEAPQATADTKPEPARDRTARKAGSGRDRTAARDRRRQTQRRSPLPQAKRELLISVDVGEQRVALLEDDRVAEVYLERPERRSIAGNIYLGTVDNVLPGMEAAFVEIGLEKNGFLYVDEIVVPELEGKRHGKKITDLIQRGQQLLVQAVKDPMKTKGARLTTEISLPGRFLVFVPNGEGLGVSRRLEDAERQRLKDILKDLLPATGGVIVRTAAEGASAEDIERDLVFLQRLWKTIEARAKTATAPSLVYQEAELPLRIVRDLFAGDFVAAHVDSDRTYKRIVGYLKKTSPHMVERVHRTKDKEPLFERFGVEKEIASTLDRRVDLPSGGYLIFDYAEAFTVIDVNTGRFVGSRSKSSTQRLEDTATKNNLEAVKEVVRQLRLRDIGGIIVIDFIDMANPKNRQAVEDALRAELERDRTKTYVVEISPLGLVEMTRQNVTDGPREIMTRPCPTCGGDGIVVSDATTALEVERRLRSLAVAGAGSRIQAYRVALHPRTLDLVVGPGATRLAALEEATRRRFYLVPAEGHVHADHFEVLAEGRRDDLAPAGTVADGAELDLKLVEVDLYDATAAVGKLDGVDVVVADAAKLVGKKVQVVVGRALEGRAFASLADVDGAAAPITFEGEAEKPTRAPARRKAAESATEEAVEPEDLEEGQEESFEDGAEEDETPAAGEDGEPAPARKRTRRGSRGGRRRKKAAPATGEEAAIAAAVTTDGEATEPETAATTAEETAEPEAPPAKPSRKRQPRIHVPAADGQAAVVDGAEPPAPEPEPPAPEPEPPEDAAAESEDDATSADGETPAPKKRTRRGTRGGRSRRRKAPAAANGDGDGATTDGKPPPVAESEPQPEPEPAEGGGYVPMSEWIEDFDRR